MILIADNDLILKLAKCNLLDALPDLLGAPIDEIFIAPAARFQLMPRSAEKALAKCGNAETLERIRAFLAMVKDISAVEDTELLERLASVSKIDPGEQLLFATCVVHRNATLLTGDRTALRALASSEVVCDVNDALRCRVVTFESALLLASKLMGFNEVRDRLLAYPGYENDGVLKLIVCPGMVEANFEECLVSYSRPVVTFLANRDDLPSSLFEEPDC